MNGPPLSQIRATLPTLTEEEKTGARKTIEVLMEVSTNPERGIGLSPADFSRESFLKETRVTSGTSAVWRPGFKWGLRLFLERKVLQEKAACVVHDLMPDLKAEADPVILPPALLGEVEKNGLCGVGAAPFTSPSATPSSPGERLPDFVMTPARTDSPVSAEPPPAPTPGEKPRPSTVPPATPVETKTSRPATVPIDFQLYADALKRGWTRVSQTTHGSGVYLKDLRLWVYMNCPPERFAEVVGSLNLSEADRWLDDETNIDLVESRKIGSATDFEHYYITLNHHPIIKDFKSVARLRYRREIIGEHHIRFTSNATDPGRPAGVDYRIVQQRVVWDIYPETDESGQVTGSWVRYENWFDLDMSEFVKKQAKDKTEEVMRLMMPGMFRRIQAVCGVPAGSRLNYSLKKP